MIPEFYGDKCVIMAHRGACVYAPQNTLPAFKKAFEMGFTSFETDVHCTKDGQIVLCHDYKIDKVSDGIGFITDYTLDKLRSFDFGSYFSDDFKNTPIPTLEELLDLTEEYTTGGIMNIELKPVKRGESEIAEKVINAVKRRGLLPRLLISSFDAELLLRAKKHENAVHTALIYPGFNNGFTTYFTPPINKVKSYGIYAIHPFLKYLDGRKVNWAHNLGIKIAPWTVNGKADINYALRLGCDAVISDYPERVREAVNSREQKKLGIKPVKKK